VPANAKRRKGKVLFTEIPEFVACKILISYFARPIQRRLVLTKGLIGGPNGRPPS
jgi:hypothetical protein